MAPVAWPAPVAMIRRQQPPQVTSPMAQNDAPANAAAPEVIEVDSETVACDGGGGPLGHPRV